jgi:hypothetical protein
MPAIQTRRRPIVFYGPDEVYRDIQKRAARDFQSASAWILQVILDRLRIESQPKTEAS